MPTVRLHRLKGEQFHDNEGNELAGGKLKYRDAGTSSPQTIYLDSAGTVNGGTEQELDNNGRLQNSVYVDTTGFKEELTDSSDIAVYPAEDNLPGATEDTSTSFAKSEMTWNIKTSSSTIASGNSGEGFLCDTSSADQTQTLPLASAVGSGKSFTFKKTSASNVLTLSASSIDGATSIKLYELNEVVTLTSDGSAYRISGSNSFLNKLPADYKSGLVLSKGTDAEHDINISSGAVRSDDNTTDIVLRTALTKQIDATWVAGNDQGGLDTGTVAADTWYFYYAIFNPTTFVSDVIISLSYGNPTLPSGYTKSAYLGARKTDGSSNLLGVTQIGNTHYWDVRTSDYEVTTSPTTKTNVTLSVPTGYKSQAIIYAELFGGVATGAYIFGSNHDDATPVSTANSKNGRDMYVDSGSNQLGKEMIRLTDTSAQISVRTTDASTNLSVTALGWIDP